MLDINEKKKDLVRYLQLSYTACLYSHIFLPQNRLIYQRRIKEDKKLSNVNVRAIYGCSQVCPAHDHLKKLCGYLNMPELMFSNNCQNY